MVRAEMHLAAELLERVEQQLARPDLSDAEQDRLLDARDVFTAVLSRGPGLVVVHATEGGG